MRSFPRGAAMLASTLVLLYSPPDSHAQTALAQAPPDRPSATPALQGSTICASCHPGVWDSYKRTAMARSFSRPAPANTIEDYTRKNTYDHPASDVHYEMVHLPASGSRGDRYLQREWTIGYDGKQTNLLENEIDFILGSGNHARSYLHRTAKGTLVQLPLGWYSENGGTWAMNPGYDRPDHQGLQRNITYDCMFCHNGYPEIPPPNAGPRAAPVYSRVPEGIDCQRCHGDGGRHVALARRGGARLEEIRKTIFNPSRATADRQLEVCMQCHLETTSSPLPASIVRYERGPFSYRPGEPLADFILHFDRASAGGQEDRFEITGSVYRLRQSRCFRESQGALTCTTCHNPHAELRGQEAARHYTSVCRQCHGASLDRMVSAGSHTASADCVACHMPKRRTTDVVHVAMTDHLIQRSQPARDLLAPIAEVRQEEHEYRGKVAPYYPRQLTASDELYLAVAQVAQQANLSDGILRLQAAIAKYRPDRAEYYLQLGDALANSGRSAEAVPVYEEALRREPKSAAAMQRLALCLSSLKQYSRAGLMLRQALELMPDAATWIQLSMVRLQEGKTPDAIAALEKAIELDPEMPDAYGTAGAIWFEMGEVARAESALRRAIRLQPTFAPTRNNLGNLLSASNRFEEARFQFEAALRLQQNYNGARYNYALALAKVHRLDEAQLQLEAILRSDPASAGAHAFLGDLLATKGQPDRAIEQFREALRIQPDFPSANLDLGTALADSGDRKGAMVYLRKAAGSGDAETRAKALKLIESLAKNP